MEKNMLGLDQNLIALVKIKFCRLGSGQKGARSGTIRNGTNGRLFNIDHPEHWLADALRARRPSK
jgi:hypothetical protein